MKTRVLSSSICATDGFAFAPRPRVIYPVRPEKAPIPDAVVDVVIGIVTSTAVIEDMLKTAYSVGEYAKQMHSLVMNDMALAECANGAS